jgi:hypothetical protein
MYEKKCFEPSLFREEAGPPFRSNVFLVLVGFVVFRLVEVRLFAAVVIFVVVVVVVVARRAGFGQLENIF